MKALEIFVRPTKDTCVIGYAAGSSCVTGFPAIEEIRLTNEGPTESDVICDVLLNEAL